MYICIYVYTYISQEALSRYIYIYIYREAEFKDTVERKNGVCKEQQGRIHRLEKQAFALDQVQIYIYIYIHIYEYVYIYIHI
jgi:hypothetical protein